MSESEYKQKREAFWAEFTRNVRTMHFLSDISEKTRTPTQSRQLDEAREFVMANFEDGSRMMGDNLFAEMRLDFDQDPPGQFGWLAEQLSDDKLRPPKFPELFTPPVVNELIVKIYGAQTTIASTLEEIDPAYRKWLDFESRMKLLYKAACGLDKEWQTDALFQTAYPEDMYRMVRRLGEYVGAFKLRLDQLIRAYDALSRIITVMEMNPTEMLVRKSAEERPVQSHGFGGRRGFGQRS